MWISMDPTPWRFLALVPPLITLILVLRCLWAIRVRGTAAWRNTVYLPNFLFGVGLLGNIFVIPATLLLWREDYAWIVFALLCLVGWSMELAHANCWVRFDDRSFTHHTFFGRTHRFSYDDLTGIRRDDEDDLRLYCDRHMIFLDHYSLHLDTFMRLVDRKAKHLRDLSGTGWDPYKHKVPGGKSIFLALMLLLLFVTGLLGFSLYGTVKPPKTEENTRREELVFVSGEELKGGVMELTTAEGHSYRIAGYIELSFQPEKLWDGKTVFTVWSGGKSPTWIYQIKVGEQMLMSFADQNQAERENNRDIFWLLLIFWAGTLLLLLATLVVGRHPERFSPRVRHWFFRDL